MTSKMRRKVVLAGAAAAGSVAVGLPLRTYGQAFPTREIKLYVPLSPGSSVDTLTRAQHGAAAQARAHRATRR